MKSITTGIAIVLTVFVLVMFVTQGCEPDVAVRHGDDIVASSVCGIMYVADPNKASRADFQLLLQEVREKCPDALGTEENHRNPDGTLKHAVLVAGSWNGLDTCTINWELTQPAALRAYEDACINKNP